MTELQTTKKIHPLVAAAAVSVVVVSLVGVAAITGLLPNSNSAPKPASALMASGAQNDDGKAGAGLSNEGVNSPKYDARLDDAPEPRSAPEPKSAPHQHPKVAHKAPASTNYQQNYADNSRPVTHAQAICDSCGVVESVRTVEHQAQQGSGLGAAAGAILGGVLGHQVGGGNGKQIATVAGAVGGGYAGNEIEKRNRTSNTYEVRVRMENGQTRTFTPSEQPEWRAGDHVRIVDGRLTSN